VHARAKPLSALLTSSAKPVRTSSANRENIKQHQLKKFQETQLEEQRAQNALQLQRRALELIYEKPTSSTTIHHQQSHGTQGAVVIKTRPSTASGALQHRAKPSGIAVSNLSGIAGAGACENDEGFLQRHQREPENEEQREQNKRQSQPQCPSPLQDAVSSAKRERFDVGPEDHSFTMAMRAPTKEEKLNLSRRHMSMDEAAVSSKRERALWGTRPLYDFTAAIAT
jgi:hypothetical protein